MTTDSTKATSMDVAEAGPDEDLLDDGGGHNGCVVGGPNGVTVDRASLTFDALGRRAFAGGPDLKTQGVRLDTIRCKRWGTCGRDIVRQSGDKRVSGTGCRPA